MSQTVHVLSIDGEYGPDISVHASEESAQRALTDFVHENWFEFIDDPFPATLTDADVDRFFDEADGHISYSIVEAEIQG